MTSRICSAPGCGEIISREQGARCRTHRSEHNKRRGTRQQRGYTAEHDKLRKHWAPKVAQGHTKCSRCKQRITPGTPWDLGHTDDRTAWTGPEHATCNRSAGGRKAHQ